MNSYHMSNLVKALVEDDDQPQEIFGPGSKFLASTEEGLSREEVAKRIDQAAAEGFPNLGFTASYPAYMEVWVSPHPVTEPSEDIMDEGGYEEAGPISRDEVLAWF